MKTYTYLNTSLGKIFLLSNDKKLTGLYFENQKNLIISQNHKFDPEADIFKEIEIQLSEYLTAKRKTFGIQYKFEDGTEFQQKVWRAIANLSYGQKVSYSDIAQFLGLPKSVRAVASAIGKNPIGIIVPCHRIIAKSGDLAGYAGGIEIKRKLLLLEND